MARAGGGHPSLITVQKYKFSLDKPLGIAGEIFYRQNTRADTKTEASKHKGDKQLILIQKSISQLQSLTLEPCQILRQSADLWLA